MGLGGTLNENAFFVKNVHQTDLIISRVNHMEIHLKYPFNHLVSIGIIKLFDRICHITILHYSNQMIEGVSESSPALATLKAFISGGFGLPLQVGLGDPTLIAHVIEHIDILGFYQLTLGTTHTCMVRSGYVNDS